MVSVIVDMTNSLQRLMQQGRISRMVHADRDAGQVAACIQRFKRIADSFLVGALPIDDVKDCPLSDDGYSYKVR
jgi:hypothetical protein